MTIEDIQSQRFRASLTKAALKLNQSKLAAPRSREMPDSMQVSSRAPEQKPSEVNFIQLKSEVPHQLHESAFCYSGRQMIK